MRRLAVLAAAALVMAPAASAASKGPVFGLRAAGNPKLGYFVYTLAPGASRSGAIIVSNSGTAAGTVKLFTADATTGHTTGTVYLTDRKATGAGSWVKLAKTQLTLAPGAHRSVPFTVRVPKGTKPGQWVGGIVAETSHRVAGTTTSKSKASVQIKIRDLTIVAVQANVPGPKEVSFRIGAVKTGGQRGFQQLIVGLTNSGNQLRKPTGRVVVRAKGAVVQTLRFTMDTFLPQTSIDYPILLKKALGPGTYTADVALDVPGPNGARSHFEASPTLTVSNTDVKQVFTSAQPTQAPPVASTSSSSSTPWAAIAIGAAVLVLLLLLAFWLLRSRRRREPEEAATETPAGLALLQASEPPAAPVAAPAPEPSPAPEPTPEAAAEAPAACDHYWDVDYNDGQLGDDGAWRFPHRCRNCGREVVAADVSDATSRTSGQ